MKSKTSWGILFLVILAACFTPLIPNDALVSCDDILNDCNDVVGYISLYDKYVSYSH